MTIAFSKLVCITSLMRMFYLVCPAVWFWGMAVIPCFLLDVGAILGSKAQRNIKKKLHRDSGMDNYFLLFYSPQPQRQVKILIYRKWPIVCLLQCKLWV